LRCRAVEGKTSHHIDGDWINHIEVSALEHLHPAIDFLLLALDFLLLALELEILSGSGGVFDARSTNAHANERRKMGAVKELLR